MRAMMGSSPGSVTRVTGCRYTLPARARPNPRVPLVDSTIAAPGAISPRARAHSTMYSAGRSFIPPGLNPSSLAQNPRSGSEVPDSSGIQSTGVLPTMVPGWRFRPGVT